MKNVYTFDCLLAFNVLYSLDLIVGVCSKDAPEIFTVPIVYLLLQSNYTFAIFLDRLLSSRAWEMNIREKRMWQ